MLSPVRTNRVRRRVNKSPSAQVVISRRAIGRLLRHGIDQLGDISPSWSIPWRRSLPMRAGRYDSRRWAFVHAPAHAVRTHWREHRQDRRQNAARTSAGQAAGRLEQDPAKLNLCAGGTLRCGQERGEARSLGATGEPCDEPAAQKPAALSGCGLGGAGFRCAARPMRCGIALRVAPCRSPPQARNADASIRLDPALARRRR